MELINLYALAEDRRSAREREARHERLVRRSPRTEQVAPALVKSPCTGKVRRHPASRPAA